MKCWACKSEVAEGAKICLQCKCYQAGWRNFIPYLGGLAALLALLASAATYVLSTGGEVAKRIWWRDHIEVVEFSLTGQSSFLNVGDGSVYLSYVEIKSLDPKIRHSLTVPIGTAIKPGEMAVRGLTKERNALLEKYDHRLVSRLSDQEWDAFVKELKNLGPCVLKNYMAESDPGLRLFREYYGDELRTFPATAKAHFIRLRDGKEVEQSFEILGMLNLSHIAECKALYPEENDEGKAKSP